MACFMISILLVVLGLNLSFGQPFWPCEKDLMEFAATLDGDILLPGDEHFDDTEDPWVHIWPGDYIAVARPESEGDLVKIMQFAGDHDLPVSLWSTGMDYRGRSTGSGRKTFHISLKKMKDIHIIKKDPENNNDATITIQTGNTFEEIYKKLGPEKKFMLGPLCTDSGPGGWYLGGGSSKFTPELGLGVDQIIMIRVVTAKAEILEVRESGVTRIMGDGSTEKIESDLWWALRGGGSGIGVIVSSVKAKLYDDSSFVVYNAKYPLRASTLPERIGEEVFNDVSNLLINLPDKWGGIFWIDNLDYPPAAEQVGNWPENTIFQGYIEFNMAFRGTWKDAKAGYEMMKSIKPQWALYSEAINYTNHLDYIMAEGLSGPSDQAYLGGTLLQNEDFIVHEKGRPTPFAATAEKMFHPLHIFCGLTIVGGNAKSFDETLYAVSKNYRNARASFYCWSIWENPDDNEENIDLTKKWIKDTMYPIGKGKYINKAEQEMPLDWRAELWGDKYERLLAAKIDVDPENLLGCKQCVGFDDIPWHRPQKQNCKWARATVIKKKDEF